ncbi:hypothetical protein [Acidimangrovimonas sediminis]|uniref:hypothetical protein n=1 Tax=Acidimangrovimonas sediminis TaxID=2056283 RepID=UPI000C81056D|nr:hypothetical protein [Acidimangrovimonas sediminis]
MRAIRNLTATLLLGAALACPVAAMSAGTDTAAADPKFALVDQGPAATEFAFDAAALDFVTATPEAFRWMTSDTPAEGFAEFGLFTDLTRRWIGYDPMNRDRLEISVLTARVVPDRVATGSGYAQALASGWGRHDFGALGHDIDFGEAIGGNDDSGAMIVNRVAVFRRGDLLLIVRAKFDADHFDTAGPVIARFLGTLAFKDRLARDPVRAAEQTASLPMPAGLPPFAYRTPANWRRLDLAQITPGAHADLWYDAADPARNAGFMAFRFAPSDKPVTPQRMADAAGGLAQAMLLNLIPDTEFTLEPQTRNAFAQFDGITQANGLFVFLARLQGKAVDAKISVLETVGKDGALLGVASLGPLPDHTQALWGSLIHSDFALALGLDALTSYWKEVTAHDQP